MQDDFLDKSLIELGEYEVEFMFLVCPINTNLGQA